VTEDSGLAVTGQKKAGSEPPNIQRTRNAAAAPRRFQAGWYAFILFYGVDSLFYGVDRFPYQRVTVSVHMIDPDVPPIDGFYKWLGSRCRSSDSVLDVEQRIRDTDAGHR
jgi:hypothetical protein